MYDLYYSPGACSMAVHIAMEELGLEYKAHKVSLKDGEHKTEAYKKINPRQQVAALMTSDGVLSENAGIIIYLNDKHDGDLIPRDGYQRGLALQWLMFANSTLHGAYGKAKFIQSNTDDQALIKKACDDIQAKWDEIERHLNETGNAYLAGKEFSAADIYTAVVANWDFVAHAPGFGEKTKALLKNVSSRPAYQKIIADEDIEYKAAA